MTRFILLLLALIASIALINAQATSLTLSPSGSQLNACQTNLTLTINPTIAIAPNYTLISRSYVWIVNVSNISTPLPNSINSASIVVNLRTLLTLTQYTFGVQIIDFLRSNTTNSTISQFAWAPNAIGITNGTLTSGTPQLPICSTSSNPGNNNPGNSNNGTIGVGASIKNDASSPIVYGGVLYHVSSSVAVLVMIGFLMMLIDSIFY
ncbi:predicted protein [Naegleria gruberi]|uniref:Predicted protein n=1 Tax=Naegleria gruberi TaxID=5762 RepID=D2VKF2_NAEGR|nr:uncharacterized protein NAEGRDRAFT_69372 [Naegleria gruberi]EFC42677.1 predicted protein [Naegleria gruberi]|eukprot:XP_002675421.1 predicted protein [Naegleria gruberi strain NEG-M]